MRLRVIDFGYQPALRSQAVYHGVAEAMGPDDDPVVTLVNPETPYVCLGLHQEVSLEVDEAYCAQQDLPIIRRHVGGGAVYLDRDQMFFHFIYPTAKAPQVVSVDGRTASSVPVNGPRMAVAATWLQRLSVRRSYITRLAFHSRPETPNVVGVPSTARTATTPVRQSGQ